MSGESSPVAAARFVARYVGSSEQPSASTSGQVQIEAGTGAVISGLATVCTYLVRQSAGKHDLLGGTPELQAQVTEWLTWATVELTPLMDDKLLKLNQHLATCSYLVGGSATLADLVIFGLVHSAAVSFPSAQTLHFCNLLRWCDLLQNTVDSAGFFQPRLSLNKPRFVAPPPPPPPVPKAAPAAATPAAAAAAAKGAPAEDGKAASAAPVKEKGAKPVPAAAAASTPASAPSDGKPEAPAAAAAKKDGGKDAKKDGAGKDAKKDGPKDAKKDGAKEAKKDGAVAPAAAKAVEEEVTIDMLDCRVGRIVKVDKHPNADALYLEEIDLGEEKPRQVISGLRNFVPLEQMQDRVVVVVCNLKPAKMRDVMSYGMVLCASDDSHGKVEPVLVPEGVPIGERLTVEGFNGSPVDEINPKKKVLERLFPDMKTNEAGVPMYKGQPFMTSKGPLSSSVPNGWVK